MSDPKRNMNVVVAKSRKKNPNASAVVYDLSYQRLDDEVIEVVKALEQDEKQMEQQQIIISMTCSWVSDIGCKNLAKFDSQKLKYLNLTDNCIGYFGCRYLSKVHWPNLRDISLINLYKTPITSSRLSLFEAQVDSLMFT